MLKPINSLDDFDPEAWCAGITETSCSQCGQDHSFHISYWYPGMLCPDCKVRAKYPQFFTDKQLKHFDDYVTLPKRQPDSESVTPDVARHVKALLPEMKSANICECCGKAFETARRHAATCSAACRKAKSRKQCK